MCGRYVLSQTKELSNRFGTLNKIEIEPSYNIAPSFRMPVVTRHSPNSLEIMKWGLIPH